MLRYIGFANIVKRGDGENGVADDSEFCTTREAIERIKDILSNHIKGRVYDWHVADSLRLSYANLATMKSRDTIPLKEITLFCDRCGINPLKIVMKKSC